MMKQKFGCLGIFVTLLLMVSLLLNLVFLAIQGSKKVTTETKTTKIREEYFSGDTTSSNKIALIDLVGIINSEQHGQFGDNMVEDLTMQLDFALKDPDVKAIILRIDSPGGEVTASDIIYHQLSRARAKKPIVVYMQSVAASGAFYSAMGCSYLIASDTTITASIGVIMESYNYMDLLGKVGVKAITFKSGKLKDLLSPTREMTEEEKAFVQALIDETYGKFVGIVARERKLDEEILRRDIADGRILSGKQALQAKLIDGLGYFEDAVTKAKDLGKTPDAKIIRYLPSFSLERFFGALVESHVGAVKVQLGPDTLPMVTGKFYYLCPLMVGR